MLSITSCDHAMPAIATARRVQPNRYATSEPTNPNSLKKMNNNDTKRLFVNKDRQD